MTKKPTDPIAPRFDGVARKSTELLRLIDVHLAANGRPPDFLMVRGYFPESDEASVWSYLFDLKRTGSIELALSCRPPRIARRVPS